MKDNAKMLIERIISEINEEINGLSNLKAGWTRVGLLQRDLGDNTQ